MILDMIEKSFLLLYGSTCNASVLTNTKRRTLPRICHFNNRFHLTQHRPGWAGKLNIEDLNANSNELQRYTSPSFDEVAIQTRRWRSS